LRTIVAWILGVVLPFPGFVASFDTTSVADSANRMWNMGYLLSIAMSGSVYYILSLILPDTRIDRSLGFEELASQYDGAIDDEVIRTALEPDQSSKAEKEGCA
jgi:hypothetical protein